MTTAIGYIRVSTRKQEESGLGMEAQQQAVQYFARCNGWKVLEFFTEVESGRKDDRPEIAKALMRCRHTRSTLVVAKLDRLARDVGFLDRLMKSQVSFVACDQPHANKMTLTILMAVAQDEAERISQRTIAALAARRARGLPLGAENPNSRNLTRDHQRAGALASAKAKIEKATQYYSEIYPQMVELRESGMSAVEIAEALNDRGVVLVNGHHWNVTQVYRVFKRCGDVVELRPC